MLRFALRPLRQLAQALVANDSPRQVAWGFVIGMMIGLVPKGNFTAVLLGMMLLGLSVNKPAGLTGAALFSLLGMSLDTFAHRVGSMVLVWEPLRETHTWLYESSISPLLGLNNTVVVGQLLIGMYFIYPAYWLSHRFAVKVQAPLSAWLLKYRAVRWLRGAELGSQWGIEG